MYTFYKRTLKINVILNNSQHELIKMIFHKDINLSLKTLYISPWMIFVERFYFMRCSCHLRMIGHF